jgi:branched-chain amino acid transport system substrate-binding protein
MCKDKRIMGMICAGAIFYLLFSSVAMAADTVKIGVIFSLTGPGSVIGTGQMDAAKLAIEEINGAGGVKIGKNMMKMEGLFRDDETKPEVAVREVKDMVRGEGVSAIVGGTFGNISMALNNESKMEKFFYTATNGVPEPFFKKDVKSPTACCIVAAAEWAGRGAAAYMVDKMKAQKIACLMPDYSIGKGTMGGFEAVSKQRPGVQYEVIWHPVGAPDMTPYLIKAMQYGPDFLFLGSWGDDAVTVLKQAYEMGVGKKTKIFHFWLMDSFATGIPAEAIQGVYGQMFWYHDMRGFQDQAVVKASEEFTAKYTAKYKIPPGPYDMTSYYAVREIARAMEMAGSTDPSKMYAALMAHPEWNGAKGPGKWREDGVCVYNYSTWIVEGKGPEDRKADRYPAKFDFAKIVDVYAGHAFVPTLQELGY